MREKFYPDLVKNLPEADVNWPGMRAWALTGKHGQVIFIECEVETQVGEHTHGAQFGAVLDGNLELTIEGKKNVLKKGDTYFIPAGARHSAKLSAGFRALDFFQDPERYKIKQS
jgi:quercetin dioxygenase-like cupin family protein